MTKGRRFTLAVITAASVALGGTAAAVAAGTTPPSATAGLPGGATSLSETHGDWTVACRVLDRKGKSGRVCSMTQQQTNRKGQRALAIELRPEGDGATGVVVLPFGVAVTKGMRIAVDGTELGSNRPFSTCLQIGCLAPLILGKGDLGKLQAGKKLAVTAAAMGGRTFAIPASLKGFTSALKRTRGLLPH
jgi:invasion protein IalB